MNLAISFLAINYPAVMAVSLLAGVVTLIVLTVSFSKLASYLRQGGHTDNDGYGAATVSAEPGPAPLNSQTAAAADNLSADWSEEWVAVTAAAIACYEAEQTAQADPAPAAAGALPQPCWQAPTTAGFRIKPRRRVS
ncbi:MAG: hypothetical protein PHR21_00245 [Oscillospiraceae bacterium]|nr:hypothetical protein [Oscillospiraceae bacterium]MDD4367464.1 hypothetical protein [Oscillospiraceae bacterium]